MAGKNSKQNTGIRISLTKEIADTLVKKIMDGQPLFTDEQYNKNLPTTLQLKDGVFELKPATYRQWMSRRNVIPENNRILYQVITEARYNRRMTIHEEKKKSLVLDAQNYLIALQKLPLGTSTRRVSSKKGHNQKDGDYWEKSEESIETPLNPAMVAQKRQGAEYILNNLDPAYKKDAAGGVTVMVSLGDLRKEKASRDEMKEVPKEDYKVTE